MFRIALGILSVCERYGVCWFNLLRIGHVIFLGLDFDTVIYFPLAMLFSFDIFLFLLAIQMLFSMTMLFSDDNFILFSHARLLQLDFAGILQTLHKLPATVTDTALFRAIDMIPPLESVRGFVSSTGTRARRGSVLDKRS